jgi:hypothetical protein
MKVKKLFGFTVLLVVVIGLATTPVMGSGKATAGLGRAPDPPWCYPWGCDLLADDYPDLGGQVKYNLRDFSFKGSVDAWGLLPNFLYQIKLEGRPTCKYGVDGNDEANLNIGSIGRWWNDTKGQNETDATVGAAMAAGDCVLGYIIFDCATTDGKGTLQTTFDLDWSYHICGVDERGAVTMPDGDYDVNFILTEDPAMWRTVATTDEIHFTVDHLLDSVDIGSGDGYEGDNSHYYMKYWSLAVCPTETGGSYGAIASDPDSPDGECRLVWAHDFRRDHRDASLYLWNRGNTPSKLVIRALDGLADDSFKVWIHRGSGFEEVYTYNDAYNTETWVVHDIPLPGGAYSGSTIRVKIKATGPKWSGFDTYGQLAVDWIELWK